jgi:cbb3-type cytochrome oxidase subunit 3
VGDTSNWEFAAVVAAVSIGLCGLLVFTIGSIVMNWIVLGRAAKAARDASEASLLIQDTARGMATHDAASRAAASLADEAQKLAEIREQSQAVVEQQARLQEAVRNLVEANVLGPATAPSDTSGLAEAIERLDEHMGQLAAAIAAMGRREM